MGSTPSANAEGVCAGRQWDRPCGQTREGPKGLELGAAGRCHLEHCLGDSVEERVLGANIRWWGLPGISWPGIWENEGGSCLRLRS